MKESRWPWINLKIVALIVVLVGVALKEGYNCVNPSLTPARTAEPTAVPTLPPIAALTPVPELTPVPSVQSNASIVLVWVNTNSGVYHCPNTRWYGNTKSGKYMTQEEAQARGYRPAYGAKCG